VQPGNNLSALDYQYHLKDHLATAGHSYFEAGCRQHTATFETVNLNIEQNKFLRYENARTINSPLLTNTKTASLITRSGSAVRPKRKLASPGHWAWCRGILLNRSLCEIRRCEPEQQLTSVLATLLMQIANSTARRDRVDGSGYATSGSVPFPMPALPEKAAAPAQDRRHIWTTLCSTGVPPDIERHYTNQFCTHDHLREKNGTGVPHEKLSAQIIIKKQDISTLICPTKRPSGRGVLWWFTVTQSKDPWYSKRIMIQWVNL